MLGYISVTSRLQLLTFVSIKTKCKDTTFFHLGDFFFFLEQISVFGHVLHSQIPDHYVYMRDKRGYDALDEYICEDVLMLRGEEGAKLEEIVSE